MPRKAGQLVTPSSKQACLGYTCGTRLKETERLISLSSHTIEYFIRCISTAEGYPTGGWDYVEAKQEHPA